MLAYYIDISGKHRSEFVKKYTKNLNSSKPFEVLNKINNCPVSFLSSFLYLVN